ncbi:MAG TPA: hypothetical protein VIU86_13110 [Gaiellaceae bacterium]
MITDTNPFVYSHPVAPEDVIDRDAETQTLLRHAVGGHFVRLTAPRKFGKTSLLQRVMRDGAAQEGLIPVLVDFYGVLSLADVTIRIERAYAAQLKGALRSRVDSFLKSTGLGLSLGAFGVGAKLQLDPKAEPLPALHALLDLPLRLEAGGGYRALIAFDEFQDVAKIAEMDALVRSHIQFQGEVASYVFAGSEPGMMRQLFEQKDKPLYGSAVPMRLERLQDADIAVYVADRFAQSGRDVGETLNPLLAAAQGHPQRAMHLAHAVWERLEPGETAGYEEWTAGYEAALAELRPEYEAAWRSFGTSEQKTLRAVIEGEGSPFRTRVLARLALERSTAHKALQRLLATAEVEQAESGYRVVDPLFAQWVVRLQGGGEPEPSPGENA